MVVKVFDYLCANCHETQELWLKEGDTPKCGNPDCGSTDLKKLHPSPNFNMGKTPYEEYL